MATLFQVLLPGGGIAERKSRKELTHVVVVDNRPIAKPVAFRWSTSEELALRDLASANQMWPTANTEIVELGSAEATPNNDEETVVIDIKPEPVSCEKTQKGGIMIAINGKTRTLTLDAMAEAVAEAKDALPTKKDSGNTGFNDGITAIKRHAYDWRYWLHTLMDINKVAEVVVTTGYLYNNYDVANDVFEPIMLAKPIPGAIKVLIYADVGSEMTTEMVPVEWETPEGEDPEMVEKSVETPVYGAKMVCVRRHRLVSQGRQYWDTNPGVTDPGGEKLGPRILSVLNAHGPCTVEYVAGRLDVTTRSVNSSLRHIDSKLSRVSDRLTVTHAWITKSRDDIDDEYTPTGEVGVEVNAA